MAETTYTITSDMVGAVLTPPDGYLQSVEMTKGPIRYENAVPTVDGLRWASAVFAIRGEGNLADMINLDQNNPNKRFTNLNFGYRGGLRIRSVPVGSIWQLVLSDIPVTRKAA
jgi:hypothetical protein